MDNIKWLGSWIAENCDDDWEHCYGIRIHTLDNPGWSIEIDISYTSVDNLLLERIFIEREEEDWIHCRVENNVFKGSGGLYNLNEIIDIFRGWVEDNEEE